MAENNGLSAAALVLAAAKGGGGSEPILIAEYGVTSFATLNTAYKAGKEIIVKNGLWNYALTYSRADTEYQFTAITNNNIVKKVGILSNNVWSVYADTTLQPLIDNTTDITCRTMDTNLVVDVTAPTGPNPLGSNVVRFVRLPQEPAVRYDGYWYLIDNKEA